MLQTSTSASHQSEMDTYASKPLFTTDTKMRSREQFMLEKWGVSNEEEANKVAEKRSNSEDPPLETWTKLRLPYRAPDAPPLIPWELLAPIDNIPPKYECPNGNSINWDYVTGLVVEESKVAGDVTERVAKAFWNNLMSRDENTINQTSGTERLGENAGMHGVYRFGDYVVKWSGSPKVIEVGVAQICLF